MSVDWRVVREREFPGDVVLYTLRGVGIEGDELSSVVVDGCEMPLLSALSLDGLKEAWKIEYRRCCDVVAKGDAKGYPLGTRWDIDDHERLILEIAHDVPGAFRKPHMDLLPDGRLVQVRDGQRDLFL